MRFVILTSILFGGPLLADTSIEPAKLRTFDSSHECDATQCETYFTIQNLTPNLIDVKYEIQFADNNTASIGKKFGFASVDPHGRTKVFEAIRVTGTVDQGSIRVRIVNESLPN